MEIIFVRHATAVDITAAPDDSGRELTPNGRKEIGDAIPKLREHLEPGKQIFIWASPAARALQTAQMIADALEINGVSSFDWIYTGDFEAFSDALAKVDDKAILIIVGHMPHLSIWGEQLCGANISFKKAAMAGLALSSQVPPRAELRWLLRASVQQPADVADRPSAFKDFQQAMLKILSEISAWQNRFLREPDDVECAHELRVSIRQARSLLSFIKPAMDVEEYVSMQSALKAVAGRLSYIREIDVLKDQLRSFLKKDKGLSGCKALAGLLKNERKKEESALRGYLSEDSLSIIVNVISLWTQRWDMDSARFELLALKRYGKWNRDLAGALNTLDDDDHEKIHSLRIRLKKLHNVRDNILLPLESTWMELSELKLLQHDLGEICDTYSGILILRQLDSAFDVKGLSVDTRVFIEYLLSLRQELTGKFIQKKAQISGTFPRLEDRMKRNDPKRVLKAIGITVLCALLVLTAVPYLIPLSQPVLTASLKPFYNSDRAVIRGTSFHFRTYPPSESQVKGKVLFVHGLGGSIFSFEAAAPLIARQGYYVVLVDLPGFGYSDRNPEYDHNQANRADDLWHLLTIIDNTLQGELAGVPWHLAGHSMGGGTVAAMALQNEGRTRSLILIDPALFDMARGSIAVTFPPVGRWLQVALEHLLLTESGVRRYLTSAYGRVPTPDQIKGYLTPLTLPGTAASIANILKTAKNEDASQLKGISSPILALWGSEDTWVPASESQRLREIRPDVTLSIIEGAAHCPMETHTNAFVQTIIPWMSHHDASGQ